MDASTKCNKNVTLSVHYKGLTKHALAIQGQSLLIYAHKLWFRYFILSSRLYFSTWYCVYFQDGSPIKKSDRLITNLDPPAVVEEPATPETNAVEEEPENEANGDAPSAPEGDFYYTYLPIRFPPK